MRGQPGGYVLTRLVAQISVGEVLSALGDRFFDSSFCARHAGDNSRCAHLGDCSIRPVLRHLQEVVDDVLGRLTLEQLLCSEREMSAVTGQPFRLETELGRLFVQTELWEFAGRSGIELGLGPERPVWGRCESSPTLPEAA